MRTALLGGGAFQQRQVRRGRGEAGDADDRHARLAAALGAGRDQLLAGGVAPAVADAGVNPTGADALVGLPGREPAEDVFVPQPGDAAAPGEFELPPPAGRQPLVEVEADAHVGVGGDEGEGGVEGGVGAPRHDRDRVDGDAGGAEQLGGAVGGSGVGDDAGVGVAGGREPVGDEPGPAPRHGVHGHAHRHPRNGVGYPRSE